MSWWDPSGLSSFASQAFKNAQKKIDKVLDIQGDLARSPGGAQEAQGTSSGKVEKKAEAGSDGDFWSSWLSQSEAEASKTAGAPQSALLAEDKTKQKKTMKTSWSFAWGDFPEGQGGAGEELPSKAVSSSPDATSQSLLTTSAGRSSKKPADGQSPAVLELAEEDAQGDFQESTTGTTVSVHDEDQNQDSQVQQASTADVSQTETEPAVLSVAVSGPDSTTQRANVRHASTDVQEDDRLRDSCETSVQGLSVNVDSEGDSFTGAVPQMSDHSEERLEKATDDSLTSDRNLPEATVDVLEPSSSLASKTDTEADLSDPPEVLSHSARVDSPSETVMSPPGGEVPAPCVLDEDAQNAKEADQDPFRGQIVSAPDNAKMISEAEGKPGSSDLDCSPFASLSEADAAEEKLKEESDRQSLFAETMSMSASSSSIITISSPDPLEQGAWFGPSKTHHDDSSPSELSASASENILSPTMSETVCAGKEGHNLPTNSSSDISPISDISESGEGVFEPVEKSSSAPLDSAAVEVSQESPRPAVASPLSVDLSDSCLEAASPEVGGRLGELRDSTSSGNSSDTNRLDSSLDTCNSEDTVVDRGDSQAQQEGDNEDAGSDTFGGASPYSSYVKCMIEEAMEDTTRVEDSGSDNHSSGGKSEIDKSISGHDSSDDIETTTSSDIEIISTPTPNGDGKGDLLFDLSPLRVAFQKSKRRGGSPTRGHRRNDSQSSSSTYSKAGDSDQLSPGRDSMERQDVESGDEHEHGAQSGHAEDLGRQLPPDLAAVSVESLENPYHPQNLLKKLAEMAEVLQARESRLVTLSRENNDLLETNAILRSQMQQLEGAREAEMTDLNALTDEFTRRIGESDRKLQTVIREKENLKIQLETAQNELSKRAKDISHEKLLAEKDEQIAELLQEGEKLSKQQLQSNNIIKKLRVKEKESDSLIASQKKKLEQQTVELEHLRKVCDAKDDLEKKQTEAIGQLNSAVQVQEREMAKLKAEQSEHQEKVRGLQAALDKSYKEMADLHKSNAAQDSKLQEAALSAEVQVREELRFAMEKEQQRAKAEREALIMQIEDLRLTMARMEKEHSRREDMLRQEISDLQQQLQEDEARTQELTQSVSSATRPLLRQIENLQSTNAAQSNSWEKVEKNLTERLLEAQTQLAVMTEKERTAVEHVGELSSQVTTLETSNQRLRQERSQLLAQAQLDRAKVEELEDARSNEIAQVEAIKKQMSHEVSELRKAKILLETQLDMERTKLESERRKLAFAEDQVKLLERERPQSRGTPSPVSVSRQESIASLTDSLTASMTTSMTTSFQQLQEDGDRGFLWMGSPSGGKSSVYENLRHSGATGLLEGLQSQLKQKEGEITQLQSEITGLERTRESMAKELVNLTNQNEELQDQVANVPILQEKLSELESRYNALLQMYGEKKEEADELRLDLQDVKDMYKTQIDQLLAK